MPEPKSKMEQQKTKNKRFLSTIAKAFRGEYSASAVRKRKEAEKKRLAEAKRKKEMLAKRKEANLKSRVKDEAPKGLGKKVVRTKVKDVSPSTTGKRKVTDKGGIIKKGALKTLPLKKVAKGTKDPDASRKQQSQIKEPKTVAEAQKAGLLYFRNKDGERRLAITSAQLKKFQKKHGITSYSKALTKFANMYKPGAGMAKFKADMKKMAMGGAAMKKPSASQTGLKKLPSSVRNRMGYMMGGGMPKKSHGKAGGKSYGK
jgi:hypothetical protein